MTDNNNEINSVENQENVETSAVEETKKDNPVVALLKTIWRWTKRMFFGASKELTDSDIFAVEKLESPSKLAVKVFFKRKLAVAALVVLISLFLFVFIGPLFMPMDVNYVDPLQANRPPDYSMLSVPGKLKNNVRDINGFSTFTVGVSNDNTLYMWGSAKDVIAGKDYSDFPEEIKEGEVYMAAAGYDHVFAITTAGKIIGWGDNTRAQYGTVDLDALRQELRAELEADLADGILGNNKIEEDFGNKDDEDKDSDEDTEEQEPLVMTEEEKEKFVEEKIQEYLGNLVYMPIELSQNLDVTKVQQLTAAYQTTALVYDGKLYIWGNANNMLNLKELQQSADTYLAEKGVGVKKVVLGNYYGLILLEDGSVKCPKFLTASAKITNMDGERVAFSVLSGKKVVDIAATNNCFAMLTSDGEIFVGGAVNYNEDDIVKFPDGEKPVALAGGTRHFVARTDANHAYAWGHNDAGQTDVDGKDAARIFAGSKQTYLVDAEDDVVTKVGLKGYLFGRISIQ